MKIEQFLLDRIHPDWIGKLDFGSFANWPPLRDNLPAGSIMIEKFKMDVRIKYNNKCSKCGNDKGLEAHHIKPIKYIKRNRIAPYQDNSVENGLLLCKKCHKEVHKELRG